MSRSFEQRELFNAQLAAFNRANTGPYSPPRRAGHAHAHDGAHSSPSAHSTPLRSSALLHPYASPAILDVSNDADVPRHYDDRKALDTEESLLQALARQSKSAAAFLTSSQEVLEKAEIEANARLARTRLMRSEVEVQQLSKIAQSEADSARRAAEDADSMRRRNVTVELQLQQTLRRLNTLLSAVDSLWNDVEMSLDIQRHSEQQLRDLHVNGKTVDQDKLVAHALSKLQLISEHSRQTQKSEFNKDRDVLELYQTMQDLREKQYTLEAENEAAWKRARSLEQQLGRARDEAQEHTSRKVREVKAKWEEDVGRWKRVAEEADRAAQQGLDQLTQFYQQQLSRFGAPAASSSLAAPRAQELQMPRLRAELGLSGAEAEEQARRQQAQVEQLAALHEQQQQQLEQSRARTQQLEAEVEAARRTQREQVAELGELRQFRRYSAQLQLQLDELDRARARELAALHLELDAANDAKQSLQVQLGAAQRLRGREGEAEDERRERERGRERERELAGMRADLDAVRAARDALELELSVANEELAKRSAPQSTRGTRGVGAGGGAGGRGAWWSGGEEEERQRLEQQLGLAKEALASAITARAVAIGARDAMERELLTTKQQLLSARVGGGGGGGSGGGGGGGWGGEVAVLIRGGEEEERGGGGREGEEGRLLAELSRARVELVNAAAERRVMEDQLQAAERGRREAEERVREVEAQGVREGALLDREAERGREREREGERERDREQERERESVSACGGGGEREGLQLELETARSDLDAMELELSLLKAELGRERLRNAAAAHVGVGSAGAKGELAAAQEQLATAEARREEAEAECDKMKARELAAALLGGGAGGGEGQGHEARLGQLRSAELAGGQSEGQLARANAELRRLHPTQLQELKAGLREIQAQMRWSLALVAQMQFLDDPETKRLSRESSMETRDLPVMVQDCAVTGLHSPPNSDEMKVSPRQLALPPRTSSMTGPFREIMLTPVTSSRQFMTWHQGARSEIGTQTERDYMTEPLIDRMALVAMERARKKQAKIEKNENSDSQTDTATDTDNENKGRLAGGLIPSPPEAGMELRGEANLNIRVDDGQKNVGNPKHQEGGCLASRENINCLDSLNSLPEASTYSGTPSEADWMRSESGSRHNSLNVVQSRDRAITPTNIISKAPKAPSSERVTIFRQESDMIDRICLEVEALTAAMDSAFLHSTDIPWLRKVAVNFTRTQHSFLVRGPSPQTETMAGARLSRSGSPEAYRRNSRASSQERATSPENTGTPYRRRYQLEPAPMEMEALVPGALPPSSPMAIAVSRTMTPGTPMSMLGPLRSEIQEEAPKPQADAPTREEDQDSPAKWMSAFTSVFQRRKAHQRTLPEIVTKQLRSTPNPERLASDGSSNANSSSPLSNQYFSSWNSRRPPVPDGVVSRESSNEISGWISRDSSGGSGSAGTGTTMSLRSMPVRSNFNSIDLASVGRSASERGNTLLRNANNTNDDANSRNTQQALLSTMPGTIWNAVCYAHTPEGEMSWAVSTKSGPGEPGNEWMTGQGRGVMGETPLHLAVLMNTTPEHERIMHSLWDHYPLLRTAQYQQQLYHGENVLHIAIVRKLDASIIMKFVESDVGQILLNQRADGEFFKNPEISDGCCDYGELPLHFAACTNQKHLVDYLVERGASLQNKTAEGQTILHLIVLHSVHRLPDEDIATPHKWQSRTESSKWCCDMYDHLEALMTAKGIYEETSEHADQDQHTPLTLAAAKGSHEMFFHLMSKKMHVEWKFGPVTCRKLYLTGIDVPLFRRKQQPSVMEVLVDHERLDIITQGQMKKIFDAKWRKYGQRVFLARFYKAISFTSLLLITSFLHHAGNMVWMVPLALLDCISVAMYALDCYREMMRISKYGFNHFTSTKSTTLLFERCYALLCSPLCLCLGLYRWRRDLMDPVLLIENPALVGRTTTIERVLLVLQSMLSFLAILRGMMGFPEYGHFVLMLMQMLQHDIRKFFAIYAIFLFGFSHALYIASNRVNSGMTDFLAAMRVSFQAVLQEVELEMESSDITVGIIGLANFFLVSVVLINLLIAMMSSTYDEINQGAKQRWDLVRASILVTLDNNLPADERNDDCNKYWEAEEKGGEVCRFMSFTSSEDRAAYLQESDVTAPEEGDAGK